MWGFFLLSISKKGENEYIAVENSIIDIQRTHRESDKEKRRVQRSKYRLSTMMRHRTLVLILVSFILLQVQILKVESFGTRQHQKVIDIPYKRIRIHHEKHSYSKTLPANSSRQQHPPSISTTSSKTNNDDTSRIITKSSSRLSSRSWIIATAFTLTIGSMIAAVLGILPGYVIRDSMNHYGGIQIVQWGLLQQDVAAMLLTACLGYAFVQINTWAVSREMLAPRDARKLIHTCSAPLFMLFWPMFSTSTSARVFAAIVPTINAIRLYLAGTSAPDEANLAAAVSRSGDVKEAVGGPLIYVIMLALSILLFWRDSTVGIVAMSTLAAGDGMADLIGRRYGKNNRWPNSQKSVAGTIAFWLASTITSTGLLGWMQYNGCLTLPFEMIEVTTTIALISLISAILEVIPLFGDDNYTVPLSAALLTALFFHG
jgi:phytol kinase